jgi:hypothetical protein
MLISEIKQMVDRGIPVYQKDMTMRVIKLEGDYYVQDILSKEMANFFQLECGLVKDSETEFFTIN